MLSILEYKKFYNSSLEHIFDDKKGLSFEERKKYINEHLM